VQKHDLEHDITKHILDKNEKKDFNSDSNSHKYIKKIVRWKDLFSYGFNFSNIFSAIVLKWEWDNLNNSNIILFNHLNKYKEQLQNRWQVKNYSHHWLELDNHPNKDYMQFQESEKIAWSDISMKPSFTLVNKDYCITNTAYFLPINNKYYLGLLNSKLLFFYFLNIASWLWWKWVRFIPNFIHQLPIKQISPEKQKHFIDLVEQILEITKNEDYSERDDLKWKVKILESKIDDMVYELYELTKEEIELVEESLAK